MAPKRVLIGIGVDWCAAWPSSTALTQRGSLAEGRSGYDAERESERLAEAITAPGHLQDHSPDVAQHVILVAPTGVRGRSAGTRRCGAAPGLVRSVGGWAASPDRCTHSCSWGRAIGRNPRDVPTACSRLHERRGAARETCTDAMGADRCPSSTRSAAVRGAGDHPAREAALRSMFESRSDVDRPARCCQRVCRDWATHWVPPARTLPAFGA